MVFGIQLPTPDEHRRALVQAVLRFVALLVRLATGGGRHAAGRLPVPRRRSFDDSRREDLPGVMRLASWGWMFQRPLLARCALSVRALPADERCFARLSLGPRDCVVLEDGEVGSAD